MNSNFISGCCFISIAALAGAASAFMLNRFIFGGVIFGFVAVAFGFYGITDLQRGMIESKK